MSALAGDLDSQPISKMTPEEFMAARAAAQATWDKMTPEEKAAVKKAAADKKKHELTAMEAFAAERNQYGDKALKAPRGTP